MRKPKIDRPVEIPLHSLSPKFRLLSNCYKLLASGHCSAHKICFRVRPRDFFRYSIGDYQQSVFNRSSILVDWKWFDLRILSGLSVSQYISQHIRTSLSISGHLSQYLRTSLRTAGHQESLSLSHSYHQSASVTVTAIYLSISQQSQSHSHSHTGVTQDQD